MKQEHGVTWKAIFDIDCYLKKNRLHFQSAWLIRTHFYNLNGCVVEIVVSAKISFIW